MDNKVIIQLVKSVIDTSVGGLVGTKQLDKFITTIIDKSAFLKSIRVERGIATKMELDRLGIAARVIRAKVEDTAATETGVTRGYETLEPKKVILYAALTYDWLQKALGGQVELNPDAATAVEGVVYDLISKQFMNDLVDLGFNGDDSTTPGSFTDIMDGWITKIQAHTDTHKNTYTADDKFTAIFKAMLADLPVNYKADKSKLRFYVTPDIEDGYREELAAKNTALGDLMTVKNEPIYYKGVQIETVWAMPATEIVLTLPENFAIGFGQSMLVERDKNITKQRIDLVVTADVDYNIVVPDAVVKYKKAA